MVALLVLGALLLSLERGRGPIDAPGAEVTAALGLLVPLAAAVAGTLRHYAWGRWLGLAIGLAVLPWAAVLTLGPTYGAPVWRPAIALGAALLLLVSLSGRAMFEAYEGRATGRDGGADWRGGRRALLRWTIICNLASGLALYVFVTVYNPRVAASAWPLAVLLLGLVAGVGLLARQRTVGLLLVALCCVAFVPVGIWFVGREAFYVGEAFLFGVIFAPGVLTGWASLVAFARPIAAALRP